MVTRRLTDQQETELLRGWIIYLLYLKKPKPFELNSLWSTLDQYNQPAAFHKFVEEIDHLRGLGLLKVFPAGAQTEINDAQQARLLQRYLDGPTARELGTFLYARLSPAGVQFQEKNCEIVGIHLVE
jgi:hypothetical protein